VRLVKNGLVPRAARRQVPHSG